MAYQPIEDYGIIGDMNTVALISLQGSIDWFCFPYLDSPSVFAAMLDEKKGGRLTIHPGEEFDSTSEYIPQTNILVTSFRTRRGVLKVTDFMPVVPRADKGNNEERHVLYRLLEMDKGQMYVEMLFEPRFDYGRAETSIRSIEGGVLAEGGGLSLALTGTQALAVENGQARAGWSMQEGEKVSFRAGTSGRSGQCSKQDLIPCDVPSSLQALQETEHFWRSWLNQDETGRTVDYGCFRDMVERSALVLKLLYFEPEGTIAAAATTSLPEAVGGERNWDYRYTWIRDTSFTLQALFNLGHMSEIEGYLRWIERILSEGGVERMQIMYGLRGERELPETRLSHFEGYKGSGPVHIGNAASDQKQMDIYGELLDAALKLSDRVISTVDETMRSLTHNGLVYRYRSEDGLQGDEGTFLLCSFWLRTARIRYSSTRAGPCPEIEHESSKRRFFRYPKRQGGL